MFRQMSDPDLYHGKVPWNKFEGWYFKINSEDAAFAFIPGIFHGDSRMEPHSFLQILDGVSTAYDYVMLPPQSFRTAPKGMELGVGDSRFSFSGIKLKIESRLGRLEAGLSFSDITKWRDSARSHRSMGFYNFIPFMECYSQVCAMDMGVSGFVSLGGRRFEFKNGRGYIEKNWGSQFPLSWLWVQCNRFEHHKAALSASIGHIPFILGSFKGFLIGLQTKAGFFAFTSMNGAALEINNAGRDREIKVQNATHRLEIATFTSDDAFMLCNAPKDGQMIPLVRETLAARIHTRLSDVRTGRVLFEDDGRSAGIEYGGEKANG